MADLTTLSDALALRRQNGLYRSRQVVHSPQQPEIVINGRKTLSFCSNDYLGLANHPEVIASFKQAVDKYGVGSGASHLVTGHTEVHHALEEELAAFTGRARVLLFSSGYMANMGVISALVKRGDHVFEDKLNHASLLDGGLLSGARFQRYLHNDPASLRTQLAKMAAGATRGRSLIVSDGVFSMDGDTAELPALIALAQEYNALLMIDDAHGLGCLGERGQGLISHFAESGKLLSADELPVLIGTLGKALGTSGAFVAGSELLIESLIQFSKPYIYTTAMPAAVAQATRTSLRILQEEAWRREKLQQFQQSFRRFATDLGFQLLASVSPIQPLVLGAVETTVRASKFLAQEGIYVTAIRPPTVPEGSARLRFTFSAAHTENHLARLCDSLEKLQQFLVDDQS